jgi:hypothetical protein
MEIDFLQALVQAIDGIEPEKVGLLGHVDESPDHLRAYDLQTIIDAVFNAL